MPRKEMKRPGPIGRFFFRLPIWLYRLNLGFLLGQRFVEITQIGRISGQPRRTVVEVVGHDEAGEVFYVASGWGEKADWYQNLMANPDCHIRVGRLDADARARRLEDAQAEQVLLDYARAHPLAMRELAAFMGFEVDGSDEGYRQVAHQLPFLALQVQ